LTDALIREWLFRFGVEHEKDVAPLLPLWLEAFAGMDAQILERLFSRALRSCKFFPKVSEILEPLTSAEQNAAPSAAEEAWKRVLEIRRVHWNPDIPGPFDRAVARLSERVRQAARAAGVWRDFESVEALHTWAKKRFVESFITWGELERDQFLLPDGEVCDLLAEASQKFLPPSSSYEDARIRGLAYAQELKDSGCEQPDIKRAIRAVARELSPRPPMRSLEDQEQILRERGLLK